MATRHPAATTRPAIRPKVQPPLVVEEQHGFAPLAEHCQKRNEAEGYRGAGIQRPLSGALEVAHPGLGVLFEIKPAAHVEHEPRRNHHHARFDEVVVLALEEQLEHHRRAEARKDGETGADIERPHLFGEAGAVEESGECRDHQQGFQSLTQKDRAGLKGFRQGVHGHTRMLMGRLR
jgi:hypothetical protein